PASNPNGSLDVYGWSTADTAIVQQYTWQGGVNQQWNIVPAN
ncbi:MAG: RICIN domain-containing protein, partial [Pseudomonadota bacterium]